MSGRRGSRTPKPSRATRFRGGIPRQWQSFQGDPGRRRTCNRPGKNRELCQLELRSQSAADDARPPLLHMREVSGNRRFQLQDPRAAGQQTVRGRMQRYALPSLHPHDVAGRDRTRDASRFRRALYQAELQPHAVMGGAGVELATSSVSERRSLPPELSAVDRYGQGWIRTSSFSRVNRALSR